MNRGGRFHFPVVILRCALRLWSMKKLGITLAAVVLLIAALFLFLRLRYGGGTHMPDRSGPALLDAGQLEVAAELPLPPGNIAVSESGRLLFTFHPEGKREINVAEWVDGSYRAYPGPEFQSPREGPYFQTVLSMRIDGENRLWTLDFADHGTGQPRIYAFDLDTDTLVHEYEFPPEIAGLGSMLNDFNVGPENKKIYIAEASIFAKTPALIVYDIETKTARRLLEGHESVQAPEYITVVDGEPQVILGVFAIRPGADSITLDRQGRWLYYAAVTGEHLYRVRTADLNDESLSPAELAARVEVFFENKTHSDGITIDDEGNVYVTDPEHFAVHRISAEREMTTLFKDPKLRWPDGFSFGPDGYLYLSCSALQHVVWKGAANIDAHAPYHIFRFRPGPAAAPGQ